jgi:hypothetical protein
MAATMAEDHIERDRASAQELIGDIAERLNDTRPVMRMDGFMLAGLAIGIGVDAAFGTSAQVHGPAGFCRYLLLACLVLCCAVLAAGGNLARAGWQADPWHRLRSSLAGRGAARSAGPVATPSVDRSHRGRVDLGPGSSARRGDANPDGTSAVLAYLDTSYDRGIPGVARRGFSCSVRVFNFLRMIHC